MEKYKFFWIYEAAFAMNLEQGQKYSCGGRKPISIGYMIK